MPVKQDRTVCRWKWMLISISARLHLVAHLNQRTAGNHEHIPRVRAPIDNCDRLVPP